MNNAMKLYETAVKRFPKEQRVLDALLFFEKTSNNNNNVVFQKSNEIEKLKLLYNNTNIDTANTNNGISINNIINTNNIKTSGNNDDSINSYRKETEEINIDLEISRLRQTILGKNTDVDIDNFMENLDLDFDLGDDDML
jgi:hypothetical protein